MVESMYVWYDLLLGYITYGNDMMSHILVILISES